MHIVGGSPRGPDSKQAPVFPRTQARALQQALCLHHFPGYNSCCNVLEQFSPTEKIPSNQRSPRFKNTAHRTVHTTLDATFLESAWRDREAVGEQILPRLRFFSQVVWAGDELHANKSHHFYSSRNIYCHLRQKTFIHLTPHFALFTKNEFWQPCFKEWSAFLCSWFIWKASMALVTKDPVLSTPCSILKHGVSWAAAPQLSEP